MWQNHVVSLPQLVIASSTWKTAENSTHLVLGGSRGPHHTMWDHWRMTELHNRTYHTSRYVDVGVVVGYHGNDVEDELK